MSDLDAVVAASDRWDHRRTERLRLDHVHVRDIDDLHRLHADPRVWTHFPSGRHATRKTTELFAHERIDEWRTVGLSYWSIRTHPGGPIIGCGGCRPVGDRHRWNLYYRISPEQQGMGYAVELAHAAVAAAIDTDPTRPIVAVMLEANPASQRVAEKVGLRRVWTGPDEGNPDPTALRVVYADRPDIDLGP